MLELKLNQATLFEWQRHSQDSKGTPQYSVLLEFLDLRVQAFESANHESDKRRLRPVEKKHYPQKLSYTISVDELCAVRKLGRHALFSYKKYVFTARRNEGRLKEKRDVP